MTSWVLDEFDRLKREIKPRMGRRLRGWDYSKRMIYEITIVLDERRPILGRVVKKGDGQWSFEPSAIGAAVLECWREIPTRWPQVELIECQLMPDHFHGILFIKEALPKGKTLSNVIGSFKSRSASEALKILVARDEARNGATGDARASVRARFWAEGYVDVILFRRGQLDRMVAYLRDNPRRLGVKRERPDLFKVTRRLNIRDIGCFFAIGNYFLLERHSFHQIQCSRRFFAYARDGRGNLIKDAPPSVATSEFEDRLNAAIDAAQKGAVLISPCISQGEREIARRAFEASYSVITLSNKGFSPLYKPGGKLFETCANGKLLMLAPVGWPHQVAEKPITRIDALILNRIAQLIAGDGAAKIDYKGVSMTGIDEGVIKATSENE
jgi:REP element-mobilizing transposase RayT